MRMFLLGISTVLLAATGAVAHEAKPAAAAAKDAAAQVADSSEGRALYVCDTSAATRRAFSRAHGEVRFVKAEEALRGEAWASPRCITAAEFQRYKRLQTAQAR